MLNIIVMGSGRHGKGTFCKIAHQAFGLTSISSSQMACDLFLFEQIKDTMGYATAEDCFNDRHNHRELWYKSILNYNTPDLTRLGRDIFAKYPIYDGIRARDELLALKKHGVCNLVIWVEAGERLPHEDSSSITVTRADADIVIENNGTEEEFTRKSIALLFALFKSTR